RLQPPVHSQRKIREDVVGHSGEDHHPSAAGTLRRRGGLCRGTRRMSVAQAVRPVNGIEAIMRLAPVIPLLVIEEVDDARPIAEALVAGGLRTLEVTLRTETALAAIREIAGMEGAVVGAGTVLNERDLEASLQAGARFIVSPGLSERLAEMALASGVPFLPGI